MKFFPLIFVTLFVLGCGSSVQGIRFRAQSPPINEAFRKLSLAVQADGYPIDRIDEEKFVLQTGWREAKATELMKSPDATSRQFQLLLRMDARGAHYDISLSPFERCCGDTTYTVVPTTSPLMSKWYRILNTIVSKESREGD